MDGYVDGWIDGWMDGLDLCVVVRPSTFARLCELTQLFHRFIVLHCITLYCTTGVFAFINSTFTILASINEGFQSPIRLVNRVPQSGSVLASQYAYYKYTIDNSTGIRDIKFTLTPSSEYAIYLNIYLSIYLSSYLQ
jgi:hypothetical protein